MTNITCHVTKKSLKPEEGHRGDFIRKELFKLIKKDHPDFNQNSYISVEALNRYRKNYLARAPNDLKVYTDHRLDVLWLLRRIQ